MWWSKKDDDRPAAAEEKKDTSIGAGQGRRQSRSKRANNRSGKQRQQQHLEPKPPARRGGEATTPTWSQRQRRRKPPLFLPKEAGSDDTTPELKVDSPVNIAEMSSGIEVSLSNESMDENNYHSLERAHASFRKPPPPTKSKFSDVNAHALSPELVSIAMTVHAQWEDRNKVYRAQFNLSNWLVEDAPFSLDSNINARHHLSPETKPRRHRLPLIRTSDGANPSPTSSILASSRLLFDDVLFLLRSHDIVNEVTCVREELANTVAEIQAVEEERTLLQHRHVQLPPEVASSKGPPQHDANKMYLDWDPSRQLLKKNVAAHRQPMLQEERGVSLTLHLRNARAQDTFLAKCGSVSTTATQLRPLGLPPLYSHRLQPGHASSSSSSTPSPLPGTALTNQVVTIRPEHCQKGGAAASIQQVCLLRGATVDAAFFMSRDQGKSYYWGRLPDRLFRRIKATGSDPHHLSGDLLYLSTGPLGSYYAEFRSGECWWGCVHDDEDFHIICSEWSVHRVVFGPCSMVDDPRTGHRLLHSSWIVIGRDGRAAWKNLPLRLHHQLESRLASEPALAEVSLGYGDSYFCRFVDGTTDYCLPAHLAALCDQIEEEGSSITAVYLHPELAHEFVIRHK